MQQERGYCCYLQKSLLMTLFTLNEFIVRKGREIHRMQHKHEFIRKIIITKGFLRSYYSKEAPHAIAHIQGK